MLKKFISVIIAFVLLLGICIPASAQTIKNTSANVHILTEAVPEEVYVHVKTSIASAVSGIYNPATVTVGTPFKVCGSYYDLYYVFVYHNGKAVGTYRVYEEDGRYTGIYSENADIIERIQKNLRTSSQNPVAVVAGNYEDLYAVIDSNVYVLLEDPTGKETPGSALLSKSRANRSVSIVNIADEITFDIPNNNSRTNPAARTLATGWAETQGNQPWCNAFCTAAILRYKTNANVSVINARGIMEWTYPGATYAELLTKTLNTTQADIYANAHGIDPIYTASTRTYSQVTSEIIAGNPLTFICDNLTTGAKKEHAFVCRGYYDNDGNSYYSVWNPWNSYYENVYTSNLTYVSQSGNTRYLWTATMYDWD